MKVSIIIPCYNAEKTIKESINSALGQNFPKKDFEVIVINDGSTDKTKEIIERNYKKKIRIINQKNQGAVKAASAGFKKAKGEYLVKLDADDYFEPDILKKMTKVLDEVKEIDFVYSDYYERTPQGSVKIVLTKNNIFNTVAIGIMFRKSKFKNIGFYREDVGFAEYDLLLKTLGRWKGYHIGVPLFWYNRREESLTGNKQWVKEGLSELKKLHPQKILQIKKIRNF